MPVTQSALRLFIIESPSPLDVMKHAFESSALEKVCTLIGHEVATFLVKSKGEFRRTMEFISSIGSYIQDSTDRQEPICIHIAAHGNKDGLGFGRDVVTWTDLFDLTRPVCSQLQRTYEGRLIIVLSACKASYQKLHKEFEEKARRSRRFRPPLYLFFTAGRRPTVGSTVTSWTVFYHQLPDIDLSDKKGIQEALNAVASAGAVTLFYYRWDEGERRYLRYKPSQ